jgi:hypothetical protein
VRPFSFLIAFGAATWAIGRGWAALVAVWTAPTGSGLAVVLAYLAVFLAAFLYLGFGIYAAERAAGKVRTRIGIYERILVKWAGGQGTGNGTPAAATDPDQGRGTTGHRAPLDGR